MTKFATDIDLSQNEIRNASFHKLSSVPLNPVEAQHYYNSVSKLLYIYDGTTWKPVGSPVNSLTNDPGKVATSVSNSGGTTTIGTTNVKDLELDGYSHDSTVNYPIVSGDTLNVAFSKLKNKIDSIVSQGGEPNVIDNITIGTTVTAVTISSKVANIPNATTTKDGAMSYSDKTKLDGAKSFSAIQTETGSSNLVSATGLNKQFNMEGITDSNGNKYIAVTNTNNLVKYDLTSAAKLSLSLADTAVQRVKTTVLDDYVYAVKHGGSGNVETQIKLETSLTNSSNIPYSSAVYAALALKQNALTAQTAYTNKGTSTKVPTITTNALGQVTGITETNIAFPSGSGSVSGSAVKFVKSVSLSGHTLSGTTQNADTSITASATSIPTTAAVYAFVNSSISAMAAFYITSDAQGNPFATHAALMAAATVYSGGVARTPGRNDYCVISADETHNGDTARYIYTGTGSYSASNWSYQYTISSGFTASQWNAINSLITSAKVTSYDNHISDFNNPHQTKILNLDDVLISSLNDKDMFVYDQASGYWINTQMPAVVHTGDYNDLTNKPSIPQGTVTSVRVQATSPVVSSTSSAQTSTLNTTISLANGYGDTKNPYSTKTANYFLAAPNGSNGVPSFRTIKTNDIVSAITDMLLTHSIPYMFAVQNPILSSSGGICIWDIKSDYGQNIPAYTIPYSGVKPLFSEAIAIVKDANGEQVFTDIEYSSDHIYISMNSSSTIAAGTYTCVITCKFQSL